MTTPTVAVTVNLTDAQGIPYVGVQVTAKLDGPELYQGVVVPALARAVTDASGNAVLNLFPNAVSTGLGTQGTTYWITAQTPGGTVRYQVAVPNTACRVENIIVAATPVALDATQTALAQLQAATSGVATSAANAATSASGAATSASGAATSASNAATSATGAATSASNASTSASQAAGSASAAATSASAAATSASNAATSETNAGTSATSAANSATAANTSATAADTSATNASNSATQAASSAATAIALATSYAQLSGVTVPRLANWARGIQVAGLQPVSVMASPPTMTLPDSQLSALNASNNAAGLPAAGLYRNLNLAGVQSTAVNTGNPNNNCLFAYGPDNTDGSKHVANLLRVRFTIIQPQFEVVFAEQNGCRINALVDDGTGRAQFVGLYDGNSPPGLQSGGTRYQKLDFGADVLSSGMATSNISAAGTGYTRGDIITMSGGTFTRAAKFVVKFVVGGVPGALAVADPGDYTVLPSFPAATTGGTGTGLTIATGFTFPRHTTAKPRKVELLIEGALLYGINYAAWAGTEAVITPYKFNSLAPKMYWLGDSQDANTYGTFAGGQVGYLAALRLGMADNIVIDAQGGTGFNVANGTSPAFEHANRVNAVIAAAPDAVVFPYSQNVAANTQVTSQAAALSFITTLQNALPNTLFVMVGPAFGFQAWHLAAMQYVMANAPAPSRIRMVDNITEGWAAGGSSGFLTTDSTHWGEWGNVQWRSVLLAEGVKNSLLSMLA